MCGIEFLNRIFHYYDRGTKLYPNSVCGSIHFILKMVTAAQYPLLESFQRGTIHEWVWNAVPYPYTVYEEGIHVV